jgi:hypothetical protein
MSNLRLTRARAAVGGAALVVSLGAGGTADAATPSHAPSSTGAHKHHHRGLLDRSDQATVEVKNHGSWVTLNIDRGKVTLVSSSSITLALADGQSVTEAISSTTEFKGVTSAGEIVVGKSARVVSDDGTARRIRQRVTSSS